MELPAPGPQLPPSRKSKPQSVPIAKPPRNPGRTVDRPPQPRLKGDFGRTVIPPPALAPEPANPRPVPLIAPGPSAQTPPGSLATKTLRTIPPPSSGKQIPPWRASPPLPHPVPSTRPRAENSKPKTRPAAGLRNPPQAPADAHGTAAFDAGGYGI